MWLYSKFLGYIVNYICGWSLDQWKLTFDGFKALSPPPVLAGEVTSFTWLPETSLTGEEHAKLHLSRTQFCIFRAFAPIARAPVVGGGRMLLAKLARTTPREISRFWNTKTCHGKPTWHSRSTVVAFSPGDNRPQLFPTPAIFYGHKVTSPPYALFHPEHDNVKSCTMHEL